MPLSGKGLQRMQSARLIQDKKKIREESWKRGTKWKNKGGMEGKMKAK